jgi:uncharacterized protein (TIGR03382 family)
MRPILILVVAVASAAVPDTADACSLACWDGYFTPGDGATVPANLPTLHWQPRTGFNGPPPDPAKVTFATIAAPGVALGFTPVKLSNGDYLLIPAQPLVAGAGYLLRDDNTCSGSTGPSVIFAAGPAVPHPTRLGTLRAVERGVAELEVATDGGSCSSKIDADQATVDLEIDPEAAPWRDVLYFETLVDGRPWRPQSNLNLRGAPGASWRGRGVDLVYELCRSDDPRADKGLGAGSHLVEMRATLLGTAIALAATTVTVELACSSDPSPACLADPAACDDDGGGCSASGAQGSQAAPWLFLTLGALLVRRRRR